MALNGSRIDGQSRVGGLVARLAGGSTIDRIDAGLGAILVTGRSQVSAGKYTGKLHSPTNVNKSGAIHLLKCIFQVEIF